MMPPSRKMRRREQDRGGGRGRAEQAHAGEQEGDHDGGEDLEEALDPQVDHPPAPVFGDRQVRTAGARTAPGRRTAGWRPRRAGTAPAGAGSRPTGSAGHIARTISTSQRNRPTVRKSCQNRPEVDVLIALVAEPEVRRVAELLLDAEPLARHRADDDDQQADEQEVDAQPLELRLVARDGRGHEQPGGQPGGGDPEDAELRVPGAGHRSRAATSRAGCRRSPSPRRRSGRSATPRPIWTTIRAVDDPEVFQRRLHRGRRPQRQQRVFVGQLVARRPRLPCWTAKYQARAPMPASRTTKLITDQMTIVPVGRLSISASDGQLLV